MDQGTTRHAGARMIYLAIVLSGALLALPAIRTLRRIRGNQ
jgi:hypothetical protein